MMERDGDVPAGRSGSPGDGLRVNARLVIPRGELIVRATRSSGAGGQHVNKTASRVEVVWNVQTTAVLADDERERLLQKLASRVSGDGELRVVASETRSQFQNRELAEEKLVAMVREGLRVPRVRKKTKPSKAAREARMEAKRQVGEKKARRRWRPDA